VVISKTSLSHRKKKVEKSWSELERCVLVPARLYLACQAHLTAAKTCRFCLPMKGISKEHL
jgi:hypothetical protein